MMDFELQAFIRDEYRNDRSWLVAIEEERRPRTRVGLFDLVVFVLGRKHARRHACC